MSVSQCLPVRATLRSETAKARPFLLWLAFTAPHAPFAPNPERIVAVYRDTPDAEPPPEAPPAAALSSLRPAAAPGRIAPPFERDRAPAHLPSGARGLAFPIYAPTPEETP